MIDPITAVRLAKSQRDLLINATTNNYLPSGGKDLVKIVEEQLEPGEEDPNKKAIVAMIID